MPRVAKPRGAMRMLPSLLAAVAGSAALAWFAVAAPAAEPASLPPGRDWGLRQTPIVDVLHNICRFSAHESCGQCTPCREGTGWMLKIAERLRHGQGRTEDLNILQEVGNRIGIMPGTTICGLADGAGWPVKNAIAKFRPELEEYIRGGKKTTMSLALAH